MPRSPQGTSSARRCAGREDDGRPRALRRRVTLISGGYRGRPRQSTHDSASSGGRAVYGRELRTRVHVAGSAADPRNRALVIRRHRGAERVRWAQGSPAGVTRHRCRAGCSTAQTKPASSRAIATAIFGAVCAPPRDVGSGDTAAVAPCPQSRSRARVGPSVVASGRRHPGAVLIVPRRFHQHAADEGIAGLRDAAAPMRSPLECSPGTRPRYDISARGGGNRRKSCNSARTTIAVSVSMPRKHRSQPTALTIGRASPPARPSGASSSAVAPRA